MNFRRNGNRYKLHKIFIEALHNWGGKLIVISGPSGVGKTTLSEQFGLPILRSLTTRERRKVYETYDFISTQEFQAMESRNELASVVKYGQHLYGFTLSHFEELAKNHRTLVIVSCPTIYKMLKQAYPNTHGFFITAPKKRVNERLLARDGHLDEVRLASYSLNHRSLSHYDVVIYNRYPLWVMRWVLKGKWLQQTITQFLSKCKEKTKTTYSSKECFK